MSGSTGDGRDRVSLVREGPVAEIRLMRGSRGNAIDLRTAEAFAEAVAQVAADPGTNVVLLTARGRDFCVGGDVAEFAQDPDPAALLRRTTSLMHPAVLTLVSSHKPVVTAVHGAVAGAGLGLVLAADLTVAADDTAFTAGYLRLGVTPDCGVSQLLPARVGRSRALDLLLTGRTVGALEARDWGLVGRVCQPQPADRDGAVGATESGSQGADQLARQLAGLLAGEPPEAVAATLRLIGIGELARGLDAESDSIVELISAPAARARMARFAVPPSTR